MLDSDHAAKPTQQQAKPRGRTDRPTTPPTRGRGRTEKPSDSSFRNRPRPQPRTEMPSKGRDKFDQPPEDEAGKGPKLTQDKIKTELERVSAQLRPEPAEERPVERPSSAPAPVVDAEDTGSADFARTPPEIEESPTPSVRSKDVAAGVTDASELALPDVAEPQAPGDDIVDEVPVETHEETPEFGRSKARRRVILPKTPSEENGSEADAEPVGQDSFSNKDISFGRTKRKRVR